MGLKFSPRVKNARLDVVESTIGTAPILRIYTGTVPANITDSRTGTVLATVTLPSDWMSNASAGSKAQLGTWRDTSADATGTAGYFSVFDSGGTNCDIQGTCTVSGGGGDMILSSLSFTSGQQFDETTFTLNEGN